MALRLVNEYSSIDILNEKHKAVTIEKLYENSTNPGLSSVYTFIFFEDIDVYEEVQVEMF